MITEEEILKIARLAKLEVSPESLPRLTQDMAQIIAFADTINAAGDCGEFDGIQPMENAFREDEVQPLFPREEILKNVGGGVDGYFSACGREG